MHAAASRCRWTWFVALLATACGLGLAAPRVGRAQDVIKANNTTALNDAASWVSGGPPGAGNVAVWGSTVGANTSALGGNLSWQGIRIADPGGAIAINATTSATLTLGSSGIDMSQATQNLTVSPNLAIGANQTWNVAGGRTLTGIAGSTTSVGTGTGNVIMSRSGVSGFDAGTATIVFNANGNGTGWGGYSGNLTVNADVKVQSQGNAAAALGSGTLTLAGGQIFQRDGTWTWGNNIAVTADSVIGNDSSSGLGRTLKLLGDLTSSTGSGLTFTNNITGGTRTENVGFLLAGATPSTYGTTTISANSRVRVGGNATATTGGDGLNAGTRGSLGTGDVTLAATTAELAFTRTDAHTATNNIAGTGTLYVGGTTAALAGTNTQAVTLTGTNTYSGVTTIAAGTLQVGNGGTAGTLGSGAVTNNSSLVFNRSNDLTAGNAISGTGSLTKTGAGTLTLSGISSLSGTVAVNAGTLLLTGNNTFSGSVTIASSSTLRIGNGGTGGFIGNSATVTNDGAMIWNRTDATSVGTAIAGSGSVTQQGTGTLTLTGASTYTGPTVVNSGTLSLTGSLGSLTAVTLGGATFSYGRAGTQTLGGLTISAGANTITNTNAGTTNTLALGAITRTGGVVNFSNATATDNVVTTTSGNSNGILGPWATVAGTNWAAVDGSNRIVAYTAYTDVTRLSSGTQAIPDDSANNIRIVEGTGAAADITLGSATTAANTLLQTATGGATTVALSTNTLRTAGIWMVSGASALTLNAGTLTAATAGGELFVRNSSSNTLTIGSVIANNTSASSLTIVGNNAGNGIVTLSGANSFTGGTTLSGVGYLRIENNAALGTGPLTFNNNAGDVFRIITSANRTFSNNLTFGGDGQVRIGVTGSGTFNFSGPISLAGGVRALDMAIDTTFSGNVSDGGATPGSITKLGAGSLTLSGSNNTFSGTLTIQAGTLVLSTLGSLNGSPSVSMSGGTLFLAAGFANQTAAISNLSGTGGSIDPRSGGSASIRTLQVNQTVDGTFAGSLVSDGAGARQLALIKNGVATLALSSAAGNTYFGATTINAGGLVVSGQLRNTSSLTVNNGATLELGATNMFTSGHGVAMADSRVITVNGSTLLMNASMDSRIGNVTLNNGAIWTSNRPTTANDVLLGNTSAGAATVTVSGIGASTMNGTGGINLLGVQNFSVANTTGNADPDLIVSMTLSERLASGTGGFNKTGPGTMLLTGTNDYTGGSTVSAGTLLVNGSIASSSLTTVASAATLGGSGSVGATLIQGGGFHAPGTSPGIQTVTSGLEYQSGATLTWELFANTTAGRGTSYDGIDLTGGSLIVDSGAILALDFGTLAGGSSVSWSNSFWGSDQSWTIIDVGGTGAWNGSLFGVLSVGPDALGQSLASLRPDASFSVANEGGHLALQYTAVPEPATLVLAAAGLVALAAAAGRRL